MIKPLEGLTGTLLVLLKVNVVLAVIAVFTDLFEFYTYANLPADFDIEEELLPSDLVVALVALVRLGFFIYLGITFLRWIYRANKNLRELSGEAMQFTPGWAVGWYFVPIANLFKPYQAMLEIWQVAHGEAEENHVVVNWWWAFWIISTFASNMAMRLSWRAEEAVAYASAALVTAVSDGADVILTIIAISLVSRIGEAYSANFGEGYEFEHDQPRTPPDLGHF